jgi:cytochrome c oxidase subunit II
VAAPQNRDDGKHPLLRMFLWGVLASVIGTAIVLYMDWFPEQGDTAAKDIDRLYDVLLIASVPIFVLVMTIAIYSVIKFRARPGETGDGAPLHGNTRLEIIWVTIPFLIVTGLAIYAWVVLDDIEAKKPNEMRIKVTGQQFTWRFEYVDQKVKSNELVLAKDRPVKFEIRSEDVIHSFWVPEFRLKSDAVPGLTTTVRLTPNKLGEWNVVCAELCGIGHSTMRQEVKVLERPAFDRWLASNRKQVGGQSQTTVGEQIFSGNGCGSCHTFKPAGSNAQVGPNLDELAAVAAKRRPGRSAEKYVRESIETPDAFVVKGFQRGVMPDTFKDDISREELDALVQYLLKPQ